MPWLCFLGIGSKSHKFIAILVSLTLLSVVNLSPVVYGLEAGDVDGNDIVDSEDAKLIARYLTGQIGALPHPEKADVTEDGSITVGDSLAIAQKLAGSSRIVVVRKEYGLPGKMYIGSLIRIEVFERFLPFNITGGSVRIKSPSTGYDSGDQSLTFKAGGLSLYYHWNTSGLAPASDYGVYVTLIGSENDPQKPDAVVSLYPPFFEVPYLIRVQDAYAPAPDIPMEFSRVFPHDSEHTPYLGPLGYGWMLNFDIHLEEFSDGLIAFLGSDGFNRWFWSNGDGSYTASPRDYGTLTRDPDGTFQLKEKNSFIYRFRQDLRLDYMLDPNENNITYIYNGNKLVEVRHSSSLSFQLEYNSHGRISKLIDHAGRETVYNYDGSGIHLLTVTDPSGNVTAYTYSTEQGEARDHRLASIAFPDSTHLYYTYDSKGRLSFQEWDGGAGRINYSYDSDGTTHITDADGGITSVRINEHDQLTKVTNPLGSVTRYEYDSDYNLISITDSLNQTYSFDSDERGNIVQFTYPTGGQIDLGYEPNFNQISWLNDSLGRTTTFSYNGQGNLLAITYPDGSMERFTYNEDNHLESEINRKGEAVNYTFDNNGLLLSKTYPNGTSITYGYDSTGRMTSAMDSTGTTTFEYDELDRLIRITYPGGRSFQYEYDAVGKCTKMVDPDGRVLNYEYDDAGRLVGITNGTDQIIVEYQYNEANRRTRKTLGNGAYTIYEYDSAWQITKIVNHKPSGEIISYFNYTYDAASNRLSKETIEGIEEYTYDETSQLIKVKYPDGSTTEFVYDSMGNRLAVIENSTPINYTVNELNQYTAAGLITYGYDANGNLISKTEDGQTTYYDYDYENRLIRVRTPNDTITYTYNSFGLRSSRSDSNGMVLYLWDRDQVALEEDDSHQTIANYVWGNNLDEAIQMERNGNTYYYAQDAILSVSDLLDNSGNPLEHYRYKVFGKPLAASSLGNPWLFTGLNYDFEAGLQYNRFRYYSSDLGRFMQPDPIGISGGINLYSYVFNNPVNYIDPSGKVWWIVLGKILAAIAALSVFLSSALHSKDPERYPWNPAEDVPTTGMCPTFIQLSPGMETAALPETHLDVSRRPLAAEITVPVDDVLVRSDIPIFGVAGGKGFESYVVEYGEGRNPEKWHVIESSTSPEQATDVGILEMQKMQGDIDIRGNLGTWNTGLKNWVHLPWHPPEDPTDLNGVYTIRLTAFGKDGQKVEDKVTIEVGRVIAQCLPGITTSPDKRVMMRFPEHSLTEPFRVYTILPLGDLGEEIPPKPAGIQLIGPVYRIREPGDRFIKDVVLEFKAGREEIQERDAGHFGILQYDSTSGDWVWLDTFQSARDNIFVFDTILKELPTSKAIYALGYDSRNVRSQPEPEEKVLEPLTPVLTGVLVDEDFEDGMGYWKHRDRFVGAVLDRTRASPDGSYALKITSQSSGGSSAVTVLERPFDVREYPIISFDYRIGPGINTDFYLLVNGRWYNLGFTDDTMDFRNRDVNIANMGSIKGIVADDEWHSASVNLYELLRKKTRNTQVDAIMMADWDVKEYMKLEFGSNGRGVAYYIDNFRISSDPDYNLSYVLMVDNFDDLEQSNLLGGSGGMFSSLSKEYYQATIVEDITTEDQNYALKIEFNVSPPGSYSGYWTSLMGTDIRNMKEVSLRIYAPESVPPMWLGLRCCPWVEEKVLIEPYLSAVDENGWRNVTVPLSAFRDLPNLSFMEVLFITFENEISSGEGTILIDDIKFEFHNESSQNEVVNFGIHGIEHNMLGGKFRTIEKEAAVISAGYHLDKLSPPITNAVRISYGGNIGLDYGEGRFSYSIWETDLLGFDARRFGNLVLKIRGEEGGESPNIWLDDGTVRRAVRAKDFSPITSSWQEISIPLESFSGVDLSHLESIQVIFEWEEMSGTIYIAEIRFEGEASDEEVEVEELEEFRPPSLSDSSSNAEGAHTGLFIDSGTIFSIGVGITILVLFAGIYIFIKRRRGI